MMIAPLKYLHDNWAVLLEIFSYEEKEWKEGQNYYYRSIEDGALLLERIARKKKN